MKKVCFVIPRAYYLFNPNAQGAEDKAGGAQKQTFLLSTELAKDPDFDVHFALADFGQADFEIIKQVKLHKSFSFSDSLIKRSFRFLKSLKRINADYYVFRSADTGVALAVFFVKNFLRKRTIYMLAHDSETSNKSLARKTRKHTAAAMRYVYKKTDKLTAQTREQSELFEKYRNRKPDAVIPNMYLPPEESSENPPERNHILWIGRLVRTKNPEIFLSLAKNYPNEKFVMIAPVVRDARKYGEQIQSEAKEIKNLQIINFVKPNEIFNYYRQAKIYVMTSESEGFSNTMAEAMQAGCPVLSYNVNTNNIFETYQCGFYAEGNFKKLTDMFVKLIANKSLTSQMGKNGAQYIINNHSEKKNTEKFKQLISF